MWRADDIEPLAAMSADLGVMHFLGGAMSRADTEAMLARITTHWESRGFGVWAVEHANEFIGFAGIVVPRWEAKFTPCVEIMWRFVSSAWGNGFATEAARAALDDGFEHHDFPEVLSFTVQDNERSWRVMERLGMRRAPELDFDHPLVTEVDAPRQHIVYRITREARRTRTEFITNMALALVWRPKQRRP